MRGAVGLGFASYWLKNWRESFKPITKRSNRNHVITFDSHLKTTLRRFVFFCLVVAMARSCDTCGNWVDREMNYKPAHRRSDGKKSRSHFVYFLNLSININKSNKSNIQFKQCAAEGFC